MKARTLSVGRALAWPLLAVALLVLAGCRCPC